MKTNNEQNVFKSTKIDIKCLNAAAASGCIDRKFWNSRNAFIINRPKKAAKNAPNVHVILAQFCIVDRTKFQQCQENFLLKMNGF